MSEAMITSRLPVVGDEDVGGLHDIVEGGDLEAVHRRLKCADRVDLGDDDTGALAAQGLGAALCRHRRNRKTDSDLSTIRTSVARLMPSMREWRQPVLVVELRLGHRVVDV